MGRPVCHQETTLYLEHQKKDHAEVKGKVDSWVRTQRRPTITRGDPDHRSVDTGPVTVIERTSLGPVTGPEYTRTRSRPGPGTVPSSSPVPTPRVMIARTVPTGVDTETGL